MITTLSVEGQLRKHSLIPTHCIIVMLGGGGGGGGGLLAVTFFYNVMVKD